jgi:hypothetical protein
LHPFLNGLEVYRHDKKEQGDDPVYQEYGFFEEQAI